MDTIDYRGADKYYPQIAEIRQAVLDRIYELIADTGGNQYISHDNPFITLRRERESWTDRLISITIDIDYPELKEIEYLQFEKSGKMSINAVCVLDELVNILELILRDKALGRL
jgi:hypothetical protein